MKTALLLFGQPRFIENGRVFECHKKEIPYDADVFIHCWKNAEGKDYDCSSWSNITQCKANERAIEILKDNYKPVSYIFEESKEFSFPYKVREYIDSQFSGPHWNSKNFSNVLSQLWSIEACSSQCQIYQKIKNIKYDWIILARYDTIIENLPDLNNSDPNKLYLCDHHDKFPDMIFVYGERFLEWSSNVYRDIYKEDVYTKIFQPSPEAFKHQSFLKRFSAADLAPYPIKAHALRS